MKISAERAFTLIEMIVVIAIIGILVAIAFPVSSHVVQAGKATGCSSNLRQLGVGLRLYLADHQQIMPKLEAGRTSTSQNIPVIDNTLNAYITDPRVFGCPADNANLYASSGTSYIWDNLLNGQSANNLQLFILVGQAAVAAGQTGEDSRIPVFCDKQAFHPYLDNKVNMLYADGHASQDLTFTTSSQ